MPQTGSRKRSAPGASPFSDQPQEIPANPDLNPPPPMATNSYLQWNQPGSASTGQSYPDPSGSYAQLPYQAISQQQIPTNQLASRTANQDIVQKAPYSNGTNEQWSTFANDELEQQNDGAVQDQADDLDQKAAAAQRDAQSKRKQIPPFVQKLRSFLDDPGNSHLIRWSESGDSFIVVDEDEFASTLIPELFKHKKYPSFVRQLNMYGFHKKVGLSDNSMRASERKNKTPSEYYNPYFKRDRPGLVWLIYKPKNAQNKNIGKGGSRGNQEGGGFDDDADEMFNIDNSARAGKAALEGGSGIHHGRQPLMIGDTPAGNTPQDIHQELQAIRKQQQMIAALLQKTRVEHEALYEQAAKFQELHDRHENSINAILTFLATVYNRSLEGKGGGNLGNMFGAIPHDAQGQGNVVDVGDYNEHNLANGQAQGGFRRQPLLLDAPPVNNRGVSATSPAASVDDGASQTQNQPYLRSHAAAHSPAVQEVFDRTPSNRSSQSPQVKPDTPNEGQIPEADILSMINSTNANTPNFPGGRMDFPQALSHLQTADGQSPLTQNQRNDVLRLMASSAAATSQSGNNNALTSPSPPMPTMALYQQSKERLDQLHNALKQQNDKVKELSQYLAPLSPSGSIPGITDTQTYGDPSGADSLDLDQFLNTGDYFNEPGNGPFDFGTSDNLPDFSFDAPADSVSGPPGLGGTMSGNEEGRVVETANSSEATSPANTVDESYAGQEEGRSPGKRRRKA